MYRPLPLEVTIKKSHIDGLGLFSTCDIEEGHSLGVTHINNDRFENAKENGCYVLSERLQA